MDSTTPSRASRLRQLQGYLAQDPVNAHLLAEVCEAALAAGDHEAALRTIETAEQHQLDPGPWLQRRAHVAMARCEWQEALGVLARLQSISGNHVAVVHDIALVHLCAGDYTACREALAPVLAVRETDDAMLGHLQTLWLRAAHHLGQLSEAWEWIVQQRADRRLQPHAMGVASLIAIDLERFADASALADEALLEPQPAAEALVAAGYVALARGHGERAASLLQRAVQDRPRDGRAWSTLGLASMRAGDLAAARSHFEQAIRTISGHVGTWHALGWTCLVLQDMAAARGAFSHALELDRNFGESHAAVALMLLIEGRRSEAEHHLRVAERLDKRSVTAGYVRALMEGGLVDAKSVRALAERLLDRPGFFGGRLSDSLPPARP
jgi:Flp pilus assembly protein TadD